MRKLRSVSIMRYVSRSAIGCAGIDRACAARPSTGTTSCAAQVTNLPDIVPVRSSLERQDRQFRDDAHDAIFEIGCEQG